MKVVLIPDKFKGSLDAASVASAMEVGIQRIFPDARCRTFAASDGGDGFLEAVSAFRPVETVEVSVMDPLGRPVQARYLWDPEKNEAFVEMAQASGLVLLETNERDPMRSHTLGTGQLLLAAIAKGARSVFVGLGGSATSDGGMGLAVALGYRFLDSAGEELDPSGASLERIAKICPPAGKCPWEEVEIIAVNDVSNPLLGESGAARVYAPQKGANAEEVSILEQGLRNLSRVVAADLGIEASELPGSGAAGGAAYGLHVFSGAEFVSGAEYVLRQSRAEHFLKTQSVDYILTGEGSLDAQSLQGKWIQAVLGLGKRHKVPVVAVCGQCQLDPAMQENAGLFAALEISDPGKPLQWNMENAYSLTVETVARFFGDLIVDS